MIVRFPLSAGRMVAIKAPDDLTEKDVDRIIAVLRLCCLTIAVPADPEAAVDSETE